MMEVQIIKARQSLCSTKANQDGGKRLRVCAYCRVSTDSEEQESSYNAQITHYTNYISANPDWVLAGIFADDADIIGLTRNPTSKGADLVLFFCKN